MSTRQSQLRLSSETAQRTVSRIDELASISESDTALTRVFASAEHRSANQLVANWMLAAGMQTREDAIGNVIGRYESENGGSDDPAIMLGSHLDTVINAGRFDGMLGVLSALACVETLQENKLRLPYAIEVIGFADEEGVRFQSTYLGSRALTGELSPAVLERVDHNGISFADALKAFGQDSSQLPSARRSPEELHAYIELHIEQGPVLEAESQAVGVVTGIAGATRLSVTLDGLAGHAGTVPMGLRRDALSAAAQCITVIEEQCSTDNDLVGTVGRIKAEPGAGNVIPGRVEFSVDIRALSDTIRIQKVDNIIETMTQICQRRKIDINIERMHEAATVSCSENVSKHMNQALLDEGLKGIHLFSGAGHDAAAMASITQVGMLFVRCKGGISHHPDEWVSKEDIEAGANVLMRTVQNLCQ